MNKKRNFHLLGLFLFQVLTVTVQSQKTAVSKALQQVKKDTLIIPVSNADLGIFPYFTRLPNFYFSNSSDSVAQANNRTYFFDGKKMLAIDGRMVSQQFKVKDSRQKYASVFECIQEFDKVITTLGGIKVYTGKLPDGLLKSFSGDDIVTLGSKFQVAPSAYYGVVEYVIKTPEKEVWMQLHPYSLPSQFFGLLVVEKSSQLLALNTNKPNQILASLEKDQKAIVRLEFKPDTDSLVSASSDEILHIVGILQAHPEWKLKLNCHSAPVATPAYIQALTQKRATAVKQQLISLGVKDTAIDAVGIGDQQPLVPNDSEAARITNTRFEISVK